MSDLPAGYRDVPDEERQKAQRFFEQGKKVADAGQFDYAITMFLQGMDKDPENTEAHQALRDISMKRKASGGKGVGFMEAMKLKKGKDDKEAMLNAERLLAHDPGNMDHMTLLFQAAHKAGLYDTASWIGKILMQANITRPKGPDYKTFIILKDIYRDLMLYEEAVEACNWAAKIKPDDMDLQKELKDLGAQVTMKKGKYGIGKSFRDSVRDMDKQQELMEKDSDIRTGDALQRQIAKAKAEHEADPSLSKLTPYIDVLRKTEDANYENEGIELLENAYQATQQFRWRKQAGEIKMVQLSRMERSLRQAYQTNPADEDLKKQYAQFRAEKLDEELKEYTLWSENYPTETNFRYEMAARMFELKRFDEAIPLLQQVRQDPKFRTSAGVYLGRAFLEAGFADEAVDTLRDVLESYQVKGDTKAKDMAYWYGRALESKGDLPAAIKSYSQVAMIDFNYRDVQARIKTLRAKVSGQ